MFVAELDDSCGVLGGACVHAKLVDAMAVHVVEVDDVAEGFDKGCSRLIFGQDAVAVAGADVFENEPASETSDGYRGDLALVVDGEDLPGIVRFNTGSVGLV